MDLFPTLPTLLYHLVFSTRDQLPLITDDVRSFLESYLSGLIEREDGMVVEASLMPDHIHLLAHFSPERSIDFMVAAIKSESADWLNGKAILDQPFAWQETYALFSVSQISAVELIEYLRNQDEYHRLKSFKEEFIELLEENGVEYDEEGLWD